MSAILVARSWPIPHHEHIQSNLTARHSVSAPDTKRCLLSVLLRSGRGGRFEISAKHRQVDCRALPIRVCYRLRGPRHRRPFGNRTLEQVLALALQPAPRRWRKGQQPEARAGRALSWTVLFPSLLLLLLCGGRLNHQTRAPSNSPALTDRHRARIHSVSAVPGMHRLHLARVQQLRRDEQT
jgi:hypothetical protein